MKTIAETQKQKRTRLVLLALGPLWGMALASLGTKSSLEHTDKDEKKKTGRDHLPCNTKKKLS